MTPKPSYTLIGHLLDEVEIPENGTLSRVMFSGDGLRVVLFAFDEGQELTDHTASVPAVIEVVMGRFALTLGGDTVEFGVDSWVHMDAHLPHAVVALEPSVLILTLQRES